MNTICAVSQVFQMSIKYLVFREYLIIEMQKYIKAHAIISKLPLGVTLNTVFLKASFFGFQVKLFSNKKEAKEWLEEYL